MSYTTTISAAARGTCWQRWFVAVRHALRRRPAPRSEAPARVLDEARQAIRLGSWDEAAAMLAAADGGGQRDAAYLNLLGVIHELRRDWKRARRCYGRAIAADRRYEPARQNMRRLYELYTFGRSEQGVALGDEKPALLLLLRGRDGQRGGCGSAATGSRPGTV